MTGDHDQSSGTPGPASGFDVLSDTLRCVRLTGAMLFLVEASTPWVSWAPRAESFRRVVLPRAQHLISLHLVTRGGCWAGLTGESPQRFEAGDVLVIPHGDAYYLADPPEAERTYGHDDAVAFFREMAAGRLPPTVAEGGGGASAQFICGFLGCDSRPFNPILSGLPRAFRVNATSGSDGGLAHLIAFALQELRAQRTGDLVVKLRTAELLFVEVLRRYLDELPVGQTGWLAALRDPLLYRALRLLHDAPAHGWTLAELAAQTATSRSVLAERFVRYIGQPPMHYLRQVRMQLASRLLSEGDSKVASVAAAVGFESEAGFSRAFKKCVGFAPDEWRRGRWE